LTSQVEEEEDQDTRVVAEGVEMEEEDMTTNVVEGEDMTTNVVEEEDMTINEVEEEVI